MACIAYVHLLFGGIRNHNPMALSLLPNHYSSLNKTFYHSNKYNIRWFLCTASKLSNHSKITYHLGRFFTFVSQESFEAASALSPTPFSSLMLDDVFFVVKKCVRRAMSSQSIDGVCAVANNACTILETDFCGLLQTQLRCESHIYLFVYFYYNAHWKFETNFFT